MGIQAFALGLFVGLLAATSIVATVRTIVRDGYHRAATKKLLVPAR